MNLVECAGCDFVTEALVFIESTALALSVS